MVFVKVRETYDLHTTKNKMTVIGIHTPAPDIIKLNYPGLLMQCKAYRPVSCDVKIACASILPLDPLGVGTDVGDVAPEDVFNPILYKAMSNKGMSQLEARIEKLSQGFVADINGKSAVVEVDDVTNYSDEFNIYYSLLADTNSWKHANPQSGLSMTDLKPLVYEMVYNIGDAPASATGGAPAKDGSETTLAVTGIIGKAKEFPFLNCTAYGGTGQNPGFDLNGAGNYEQYVPYLKVICGCIIVPPSRLHEMFYRMVVEWTIEFSSIRSIIEIQNWGGANVIGNNTHYQNYSYSSSKEVITGSPDSMMDNDVCMVQTNADIEKVM